METVNKDVEITAYPKENKATVKGNTVDGKTFVQSLFMDVPNPQPKDVTDIEGQAVNKTIKAIRDKGLSFSFRLPTE